VLAYKRQPALYIFIFKNLGYKQEEIIPQKKLKKYVWYLFLLNALNLAKILFLISVL